MSAAHRAKQAFTREYARGSISVGVGHDNGEFFIRVIGLPEATAALPDTFDGVPVVIRGLDQEETNEDEK